MLAFPQLFSSSGLMPHGHCYLWQPSLISLHVVSDGLITLAYLSIPFTLIRFVRKRTDLPFNWVFFCFSAFIVACGLTHALEIWTLWRPDYWISGSIKAITAIVSVTTAVLLVRLLPKALAIPSPRALAEANEQLQAAQVALEALVQEKTELLMRQSQDLVQESAERVRLEKVSHAKTEFLSSMSHELRTPLNAILGFAQLLARDKREPLSERHRERVAQILKGGEHVVHLIDQLLDLARIEAGALQLTIEQCEVQSTLEYVSKTLESSALPQNVSLCVELHQNEQLEVIADRTRFTQILFNFGSNAIKYNRPNGTVTFKVYELESGRVRISVEDNGLGIPADKQAKLFQAFERAGQEAGPIAGTGVGLFITKQLAELMNATVGFRSALDKGSEFWIDLPNAQNAGKALNTPALSARLHS